MPHGDLFEGRTFSTIEEGMAHAGEMGLPDGVIERGTRAIEGLPAGLVYAGRLLAGRAACSEAGADAARSAGGAAVLRLCPGLDVRLRLA